MTQHSYTVGLCKSRRAEAQFQTKGSVLIFYDFGVILHIRSFYWPATEPLADAPQNPSLRSPS